MLLHYSVDRAHTTCVVVFLACIPGFLALLPALAPADDEITAELNIPELESIEFPSFDEGPFLPIEDGNIWIYASHSHGYGPPSVDTTAWIPRRTVIDGGQYWELGWFSGPFRLDDYGDLWYRQNERTRETVERFLNRLDDNPLLRSSEFYQKSRLFSDLNVELEDVLVVEFDGPVADVESPTADLDMEVFHQYVWELQWALPMGIWKLAEPAPNQRSFAFMCCGIEWSASILLERGLRVVNFSKAKKNSRSSKWNHY